MYDATNDHNISAYACQVHCQMHFFGLSEDALSCECDCKSIQFNSQVAQFEREE